MRRMVLLIGFACFIWPAFADFYLVHDRQAAALWYGGREPVVKTAIEMLVSDSRLVCNRPFSVTDRLSSPCIVIGTVGEGAGFDAFLSRNEVDVSDIVGKWEAFQIETVRVEGNDFLLVAGSDPRGTAYGVLELSRRLGVSPWVWWADVVPEKQGCVVFGSGEKMVQSPSVQYRGVFLNDEDWGLMPWSSKTFEPGARKGTIGPETYAKIFELLLRLRANLIWPAMHECTVPFYYVEGNREVAGKYGIVVGTSHCEPLMRNSAGEWDNRKYGTYDYRVNKENIRSYWAERLQEVKHSENFYTMGMRSVHDGRMLGVKTLDEETTVLGEVIADQRELLGVHTGKNVAALPQAFVPYKEVLKAYDNGLRIPEGKHAEKNSMVAFNAAGCTSESSGFRAIEGLGHSGCAVGLQPANRITGEEPHLTYEFYTESTGPVHLKVATVPSHPANGGDLRYAWVLDNREPVIVSVKADFLSDKWGENVLRNQALTISELRIDKPGKHLLRLYALDEELYFDQLMFEFSVDRKAYLLP